MAGHRTIYDFGMNNGDDVDYYLKKGFRVVGVEANPHLCTDCLLKFDDAVTRGDLVVLNFALTEGASNEATPFFIHKTNHVLSRIVEPPKDTADDYSVIMVPQRKASDIVRDYGGPHYIKIDVEHFDHRVLADLFGASIFPTFISAEAQSIQVFPLLAAHYKFFNLVEGRSVSIDYKDANIRTADGEQKFSFNHHSAGPFGEDIVSPWLTRDAFSRLLPKKGLGWKDIHATNIRMPQTLSPKEESNHPVG
jgi:FkbM family methyltransferase